MCCQMEAPFIILLPLLALAVLSDTLSLAMFFIYRHAQHSSYQWVLLLWLVLSLGASVALAVFLLFSYWRWERRRRDEARERVERVVAFERRLRGDVPQDSPLPSISPTTISSAVLFPTQSREGEERMSRELNTLPEIPARQLSPVRLRDLPSSRREEVSATTLGTSNYDAVVENAEEVRFTREEPGRMLRYPGPRLDEIGQGRGRDQER